MLSERNGKGTKSTLTPVILYQKHRANYIFQIWETVPPPPQFFIKKLPVKYKDSRVLTLVNLTPESSQNFNCSYITRRPHNLIVFMTSQNGSKSLNCLMTSQLVDKFNNNYDVTDGSKKLKCFMTSQNGVPFVVPSSNDA